MRVLLVNKFHYLKGGSEKYYFELGQLLKEHGNEVAYFSMKDEKNVVTGDKEYFVEPIDLNNGSKLKALDVIYSTANKKKMLEALEDFKPDIVHLNNFQRQLSASIIGAIDKKNIPMVYTAHDLNAICPNSIMLCNGKICEECINKNYFSCINKNCIKDSKLKSCLGVLEKKFYDFNEIFKKVDCIITPSNFIKSKFEQGKLRYARIEILHNFVRKTNIESNKVGEYAFYFGRLSEEKGILNLLKAFSKLSKGQLYIAGEGPEKSNIENYVIENNLENRVKLLGYLNQDEIRKYIVDSRFVIIPSICYENCPYSILESMELGKPIVGSNIGGISELVENKENGFLYEYSNVKELSNIMEKLFNDKELVIKQSKKSIELFNEKYSENIFYENLMKIYQELIDKRNEREKI